MNRRGAYRFCASVALLIAGVAGGPLSATAQSVQEFYKGRTITLVLGVGSGGNLDLYVRTLAPHMVRHIPGNPNMIIQYMPGGGGRKAAAYMHSVAPQDGSFICMTTPSMPAAPRLQPKTAKFDASKWHWIGNLASLNSVLAVVSNAPATTLDAARKAEVILGGTGRTSGTYIEPSLANRYAGTKFRIVLGYKGLSHLFKALESKEIQGYSINYLSWKIGRPDWIKSGRVRFLLQHGLERDPDLPGVPLIADVATDAKAKRVIRFDAASRTVARPIFAPPGVPADRVAALRAAFDATMKDPAFRADAAKRRLKLDPMSGAKVQQLVGEMINAPSDVIAEMRRVIGQK